MSNEDGSITVVYNGEIYNHETIRRDLVQKGHVFRSKCDTEVLVHLYEDKGCEMFSLLQGMFAFAIYDRARRRLILARDRFGIKPLYYREAEIELLFASEIKAILARKTLMPTVNRQACYDFLGLGFIPEPETAFQGIRAVPAGHFVIASNGVARVEEFSRIEVAVDHSLTLAPASKNTEAQLLRAVHGQARADVPVGALLSGGIDSSLIVGSLCKTLPLPPQTFSVKFPDAEYDESAVACAVATHCKTHHRVLDAQSSTLDAETVSRLLLHFDQPFADTSLFPTYQVCKAIREAGIICALSGDGGDEAFGGYARFWRANKFSFLMGFPEAVLLGLGRAGEALSAVTTDAGRQLGKACRLAVQGRRNSAELLAGISNYLSEAEKSELLLPDARHNLMPAARLFYQMPTIKATHVTLEELSAQMTVNLFQLGLASDMLRKVDMMSMLSGVEIRVPLLDEGVVTEGLHLPHRLKTDGHKGKLVLRDIAQRWLPPTVVSHPKHGFSIPVDTMIGPSFWGLINETMLSSNSRIGEFLNMKIVRSWCKLLEGQQAGSFGGAISRGGVYQRVFFVLALELWMREHKLSW